MQKPNLMKPQTELEKYQALRIEALERDNENLKNEVKKHKNFILEIETGIKVFKDEIFPEIELNKL